VPGICSKQNQSLFLGRWIYLAVQHKMHANSGMLNNTAAGTCSYK